MSPEEIQKEIEQAMRPLQDKIVELEAQLSLMRQVSFLEGDIKYIDVSAVLTNKLASTPSSFSDRIFIDGINNRFYVYGISWKYTALT